MAAPRSGTDPGDPTDPASTLTKNLVLSSAILALFGEYTENVVGSVRREYPEMTMLGVLAAMLYLPYNAPSFFGDIPNLAKRDVTNWPDWMNLTLTSIMAIKAVADIGIAKSPAADIWAEAEPWVDGASSFVWMVPTIASAAYADPSDAVTWLNFLAGMAFCINGTLAPAMANAKDPVTIVAVDSVAAAYNHIWGLLSVAAAVTGYAESA